MRCPNDQSELVTQADGKLQCPKCWYSISARKPAPLNGKSMSEAINEGNTWIKTMLVEARLGDGLAPWQRTWVLVDKQNWETGRKFHGFNRWFLPSISEYYLTEAQVKKYKGTPKKDAPLLPVFGSIPPTSEKDIVEMKKKGLSEADINKKIRKRWMNKIYWEYPATFVDGLPERKRTKVGNVNHRDANADEFLKRIGVRILEGGNQPCYDPARDCIITPTIERFEDAKAYYRALFHELGHWTAAKSRLDRYNKPEDAKARELEYGKEELVAEMTAAYLAHYFNIGMTDNNGSYLDNWIKAIEADANLIVSASAMAEKAIAFLFAE